MSEKYAQSYFLNHSLFFRIKVPILFIFRHRQLVSTRHFRLHKFLSIVSMSFQHVDSVLNLISHFIQLLLSLHPNMKSPKRRISESSERNQHTENEDIHQCCPTANFATKRIQLYFRQSKFPIENRLFQ